MTLYEERKTFVLTREAAQLMADKALEEAIKAERTIHVAVVDNTGALLLYQRSDNIHVAPDAYKMPLVKARTAASLAMPSGELLNVIEDPLHRFMALSMTQTIGGEGFTGMGGGYPIIIDGYCAGAVGIAGGNRYDTIIAQQIVEYFHEVIGK